MDPILLNPEVTFTAIGALIGVALTVATQTLNSILQRRSDRVLKTYETRLEIFTEFLFTVHAFSEAAAWIKEIEADADFQEVLNGEQTLAAAREDADRIENELRATPPPSPDRAALLRAEALEKAKRLDETVAAIECRSPRVKKLREEISRKSKEVKDLRVHFKKLSFKLQIISDSQKLNQSLKKILTRLERDEVLTSDDYSSFLRAAAKEVGIRVS